jgi:hypothetical protein
LNPARFLLDEDNGHVISETLTFLHGYIFFPFN